MKFKITLLIALWLSGLSLAGATAKIPVVVLISIDGLPADYFDNAKVPMPTLRSGARSGARAARMTSVFPTVTWPNHTSMVTGVFPARHGVLGNVYFDREKREEVKLIWDPVFDKEEVVKVATIYDAAHQAGLKTAGIAWPGSRNARHLDWQTPCVIDTDLLRRYTTPAFWPVLEKHGISPTKKAEWAGVDGGGKLLWDWMHTVLAKHVIQTHQPNLLLLHFDGVDSLHHRNGRNSPEGFWACGIVDDYVRQIIDATEAAGLTDRTTFIVVSDHGFRNYTKQVNVNVVLRQAGLITTAGNRIVASHAYALTMSGSAGIYVLDQANRVAIIEDLVARLRATEGVDAVLTGDDLIRQGLPSPFTDPRTPDIMMSAADGYAFSSSLVAEDLILPINGVKGIHGHLPDRTNMQASFSAWGAAIKPGIVIPDMSVVDVAPTIAAILRVPLPDVDGRALTELLR